MTKPVLAFAIDFSASSPQDLYYIKCLVTSEASRYRPEKVIVFDISPNQPVDAATKQKCKRFLTGLESDHSIPGSTISHVEVSVVECFKNARDELLSESSSRDSSCSATTSTCLKSVQDNNLFIFSYLYIQEALENSSGDPVWFYVVNDERKTEFLAKAFIAHSEFIPKSSRLSHAPFDPNLAAIPRVGREVMGTGHFNKGDKKPFAFICRNILRLNLNDFERERLIVEATLAHINSHPFNQRRNSIAGEVSSDSVHTPLLREPRLYTNYYGNVYSINSDSQNPLTKHQNGRGEKSSTGELITCPKCNLL